MKKMTVGGKTYEVVAVLSLDKSETAAEKNHDFYVRVGSQFRLTDKACGCCNA